MVCGKISFIFTLFLSDTNISNFVGKVSALGNVDRAKV